MDRPPNSPLVSVVIPVLNAEPYLAEAVESILAQTHEPLEVIVVDGGSSDGTIDVLAECGRSHVRVQPVYRERADANQAFAAGVALARGDYIARMSADDVAVPERLAVQLDWMNARSVDVCGSQVEHFGAEGRSFRFPETHDDIRRELLFSVAMLYETLLCRAPILKAYKYPTGVTSDDYELVTNLVMTCRLGNVPRELLRYRRHARQTSVTKADRVSKDFSRYRFRLLNALFPGTPLHDQVAFARLANRQALRTAGELHAAGRFMAILARADHAWLSAMMIERWKKACERSSDLGQVAQEIRREYLAKMES
ncbi:MAG: glycosyltransferase family 2 protein [Acidobacteriota bacterium]